MQTKQSIATLLNDDDEQSNLCVHHSSDMQTLCVQLSNGLSVKKSRLTDQTYVKDIRCTIYVNFGFGISYDDEENSSNISCSVHSVW